MMSQPNKRAHWLGQLQVMGEAQGDMYCSLVRIWPTLDHFIGELGFRNDWR